MNIVLIRHGETYSNTLFGTKEQILIGALDNELTQLNDRGKLQAEAAKRLLKEKGIKVDKIYTSDLGRTIETTNIIFDKPIYISEPLLRERSLGILQGKTLEFVSCNEQLNSQLVDHNKDSLDDCINKKPVNGESYQDVYLRCTRFLDKLDFNDDITIAVVSHFHTIRCMIYALRQQDIDMDIFNLSPQNATPYFFEYKNGAFHFIEK